MGCRVVGRCRPGWLLGTRGCDARHVEDDMVHHVRCRSRHPPRTAWGAEAAPLAAERQRHVVVAFSAPQPEKVVGQDAALKVGVELVFDESRELGASAGLGVGDEAGCVLVHQAVQRSLLWAVAFVAEWGATGRPLGPLRGGFHDGLTGEVSLHGLKPCSVSQSLRAPPAGGCPPVRYPVRVIALRSRWDTRKLPFASDS